MAKYRIDLIADLARQLQFTPQETRLVQLSATEKLLLELRPTKAYPFNFIVFRITGYHPRRVSSSLLTGLALQHDLGLLIEQVSATLDLSVENCRQPVLSIKQVCQRFNVTSKTIQRWRRRGLAARQIIFPDGKRRVGFLLNIVEGYLALQQDRIQLDGNLTQISPSEHNEIIRRARLLAKSGCDQQEVCSRIGRKLRRYPLVVHDILLTHDRLNPQDQILALARSTLAPLARERIARLHRKGTSIAQLARRFEMPRVGIYTIILSDRYARIIHRKCRFIDDPLYHQPGAAGIIDDILNQEELPAASNTVSARVPQDLPPYLRDLYRTPLLSPGRERALFLKLNFHKFEYCAARRKLEPESLNIGQLKRLDDLRHCITKCKYAIVQANLRLVVSVARRHLGRGAKLMELVSDGNLVLMRAVDGFDIHRGFHFATYATFSLMRAFARSVPELARKSSGGSQVDDLVASLPDKSDRAGRMFDREHVQQLLSQLDTRERNIIDAHYGLDGSPPATYQQVGKMIGLSKQRVRQIELKALQKLRRN